MERRKDTYFKLAAFAGLSFVFSVMPAGKMQEKPLQALTGCSGSAPVIEIIADAPVTEGINWLVAEEVGSRRFRVLKKSTNAGKWRFREKYIGFTDPRSKYTEIPVGKFYFHKGKEYDFSIYSGGYSSRKTPLLDQRLHRIRQRIPSC